MEQFLMQKYHTPHLSGEKVGHHHVKWLWIVNPELQLQLYQHFGRL